MDANLINCSQCGHSISSAAKICAYCGAAISAGEPNRQIDEKIPGERALSTEAVSSLQEEEPPPVIEMLEASGDLPTSDAGQPEADVPDPTPAKHSVVESHEPALSAAGEIVEEDVVIELSDHGQLLEPEPEVSPLASEIPVDDQTLSAVTLKPQHLPPSDPSPDGELVRKLTEQALAAATHTGADLQEKNDQVETEAAAEESRIATEPDIWELTVNEPDESETTVSEIMEMLEGDTPPSTDTSMPSDKSDAEAQNVIAPDLLNDSPDKDVVTAQMETAGDIAYAAADSSEKNAKSDVSPTSDKARADAEAIQKQTGIQASAEILKIEQAAQEMEEALKKQKAAMAAAQEQKREKLNLAKSEAVKRKKLALVRTQTLKKQRRSKAHINASNMEKAAAHLPQAKTKMTDLLKKYQGQMIGINYDNSAEIKKAELVAANDEFFSVFVENGGLRYSYPLKSILAVIESKDGVGAVAHGQEDEFSVVIKVYPLACF